MADYESIEVQGLEELQKDLERVGNEAIPRLKFGLEQFLNFIADKARMLCPVRTGELQSSIAYEITKETATSVEGVVGTNKEYGPYVELGTGLYGPMKQLITPKNGKVLAWVTSGPRPTTKEGWQQAEREGRAVMVKSTRGQRPQPFLLPAFTENIDKIVDFLKKALE